MIKRRFNTNKSEKIYVKANHQIRFPEVRVLGETGDFLGMMDSREAFVKSQELGKDLVLVTEKARPPVVKIIELSKYKYQLQKKAADNRKRGKVQDLKEMRFSLYVGENDFLAKVKKVREFLEKGNKVKLTLLFKGRQIAHKDLGFEVMQRVFAQLEEVGKVSLEPKLMGKRLHAQLDPITKKVAEKSKETI